MLTIHFTPMQLIRHFFLMLIASLMFVSAWSEPKVYDDLLGAGDLIRVFVYKNADLSAEFRIQESGRVTLPLIGSQKLAGLTPPEAEKHIADALMSGGFLQVPQVSVTIVAARKRQAVILGFVSKPGPVPLEYVNTRLSDVLAAAGGVTVGGGDFVTVTGQRDGQNFRKEVNIAEIFSRGESGSDLVIVNGDVVYVQKAQVFYAYGEVQKPGSYKLENKMTVQQALVSAGGLTKRGTESRIRLQRRKADGSVQELAPNPADMIQPDDVIFVRESLF